jgi:hypothetical protein
MTDQKANDSLTRRRFLRHLGFGALAVALSEPEPLLGGTAVQCTKRPTDCDSGLPMNSKRSGGEGIKNAFPSLNP